MDADDIIKLMEYQKEAKDDELMEILERISAQLMDLYGYIKYMAEKTGYDDDLPF